MIGKNIILGVTGSIAAYKALDLVVSLRTLGANVQVVMTEAATRFVSVLSFSALSGQQAICNMWEENGLSHITIAQKADIILIAPASASTIARLACGDASDILSAITLAATCPKVVCAAMNDNMYVNTATQANVKTLKSYGFKIVEPAYGRLASGKIGRGRLADASDIIAAVQVAIDEQKDLLGQAIVITAGGTREAIDAVRFISNRSSGKMGFALAQAAWQRGAKVTLISTATPPLELHDKVDITMVDSALEMQKAVQQACLQASAIIMAAAVADYKPVYQEEQKIKKTSEHMTLQLIRTEDIISQVSGCCIKVGFAAETADLLKQAKDKLKNKNLDMIVANDVSGGRVFGSDNTQFVIIKKDGSSHFYEDMSKTEAATVIIEEVAKLLNKEDK
ncbi:MAG: bifunctional phosphopantothenoylcysteine decarboxylase/phosphopantothenate--cysteine ligase CoaBC [Chloroflexi bacterium]|nr:bifunctional phosphopantothenoylcysteine decarboxylase/phosphopantothenate--cysteine ligase CoaBC [Chloroflexota bacterium]